MFMHKKIKKEETMLIVGSLLLIISFILFNYEKILSINSEIYNNIQANIYKEKNKNNSLTVNVDVDYITDTNEEIKKPTNNPDINYLAFLEIPKINLNQGLLPINSLYNNVNYHVEILKISDLPDKINGNFILAAHSGTSSIAYFRNLYKLKLDDLASIIYNNKKYTYKIVNIYNQTKKGSLNIYRDTNKTTLTLITCTKDDKTNQTVYILELIGVETY
ncbi:MAG: sortase [Erysipelotrichaceae bacterium]|nr:sortase [Erysipelotrichaceae bacterium]